MRQEQSMLAKKLKSKLGMELNSQCVFVAFVFASVFFIILKSTRNPRKKKLVPEARGRWPIIGHLHLLGASKLPHKVLATMADKYGPIFRISLGVNEAIVISSSEMAMECLQTNDKAVLGRPKSIAVELMLYGYASFGLGPYGSYWRYMRKIVMIELLSNHRLNMLSHVWRSEVKMMVRKLYDQWNNTTNKRSSHSNMVEVDLKQWFGDLTMNVIVRLISGKQFVVGSEEGLKFQEAIRRFFQQLGSFSIGDALPFLRWLDLGGQEKAMNRTFQKLDHILEGWLEEHKQKRSSHDKNNKDDQTMIDNQDFMDVLLSVLDNPDAIKECNYDADTIIKSTCLLLLAGGSDTTTITLTWAISLLLNNKHTLTKAQDELQKLVGKERQVVESDIPSLVYLQAIVKETLRLYPAAPLMGPREFIEDCTINGYPIQKGTRLIVNLSKIFRDSRIWEDPLEFRPERFLTTHKNVDVKGQHFELIPFGAGRRICPGISFGLQMVHLTLASFLHSFEFTTPSNSPVDMSESFGLTSMKTEPLEVCIVPRMSTDVYLH